MYLTDQKPASAWGLSKGQLALEVLEATICSDVTFTRVRCNFASGQASKRVEEMPGTMEE